jgi:hypothetical protein
LCKFTLNDVIKTKPEFTIFYWNDIF